MLHHLDPSFLTTNQTSVYGVEACILWPENVGCGTLPMTYNDIDEDVVAVLKNLSSNIFFGQGTTVTNKYYRPRHVKK